jgi:dolichol-phosphate mannosyltransferase
LTLPAAGHYPSRRMEEDAQARAGKGTAVVVIPTYNEADTIRSLIEALLGVAQARAAGWRVRILVVDSSSPDGTADRVREAMAARPEVDLLVEPVKRGIGAAFMLGFEHAMRTLGADVVIEFDGDFQHPPESLPALLAAIDDGHDYVLGSRAIPGGGYPAGWSLYRLALSRGGGFVARVLLFFPGRAFFRVTDPTTGLKATRVRGVFDRIDLTKIRSKGFGYKLELLFHLVRLGARIKEIPLCFQARRAGESKITQQTPGEVLRTVLWLRLTGGGGLRPRATDAGPA